MYSDIDVELARILEVVEKCPDEYKAACFEILLKGYVDHHIRATLPRIASSVPPAGAGERVLQPNVPPEALTRIKTTSGRLGIAEDGLLSLFDFTVDPFTFHAFTIPGDNTADKARNVALAVAAKSYFSTGLWVADWKEVKSQCVNQNCFVDNHNKYMKQGESSIFKAVETGKPIELSTDGIQAAENLLKKLVEVH